MFHNREKESYPKSYPHQIISVFPFSRVYPAYSLQEVCSDSSLSTRNRVQHNLMIAQLIVFKEIVTLGYLAHVNTSVLEEPPFETLTFFI